MKFDPVRIDAFMDEVDVRCPDCDKPARVMASGQVRFTCLNCGKNRIWSGNQGIQLRGNLPGFDDVVRIGTASDPYFGYPLRFQESCCGNVLWAFNRKHLEYYRDFIGEKLRERQVNEHGWSNQSLASRLPQWMTSSKNRESVVRCIEKMLEAG